MSTDPFVRTARTTGLLYLGIALTGLLGHVVIRSQLFDADDPATTLAQLADHESLARLGIGLELGIVLTQALVGLWFYRLFRSVDSFAAGSLVAFSFVNAIVMLISAAFLATALDVALDPAFAPGGDAAATASSCTPSATTSGSPVRSSSGCGWCRWVGSCCSPAGCPAPWAGS